MADDMNIDSLKMELINWVAKLNDLNSINRLLNLKKKLSTQKSQGKTRIFGSGKHLIGYIADDFNAPLDSFKEYQK